MVILLVDDEPIVVETLGRFLSDCGHEVVTARNGAEAMMCMQERSDIELVLTDVRMPQMDGLTFLELARCRYPGVPVVLVTGHGDVNTAVTALQKGAYDFIHKPVKLDGLMLLLERLAQRKRLEAALAQERDRLSRAESVAVLGARAIDNAKEIGNTIASILDDLKALQLLWERAEPSWRQLATGGEAEGLTSMWKELPVLTASLQPKIEHIARIADLAKTYCCPEEVNGAPLPVQSGAEHV